MMYSRSWNLNSFTISLHPTGIYPCIVKTKLGKYFAGRSYTLRHTYIKSYRLDYFVA
jgi:hypothetical protein